MRLAEIVFTVLGVTNYFHVSAKDEAESLEQQEETTDPPPLDLHTFVALINILFVDGKTHSCTGTIIHDYVVVTAAHCFLSHEHRKEVELSGSFVIIGSKRNFDTGSETYLPIERVIIHPRYKGWTADIALVYTFTAMATEKSGTVIPIHGAGTTMSSNVTVLSWRRCTDKDGRPIKCPRKGTTISDCNSSDEDEYNKRSRTKEPLRVGPRVDEELSNEHTSLRPPSFRVYKSTSTVALDLTSVTTEPYKFKSDASNKFHESNEPNKTQKTNAPNKTLKTNAPNKTQKTKAPNESHETNGPNVSYKTDAPDKSRKPDASNESDEADAPDKSHKTNAPNKFHNTDALKRIHKPDAPNESNEPKTRHESHKSDVGNGSHEPEARNESIEPETRNDFHETDAPNESHEFDQPNGSDNVPIGFERQTIMIEEDDITIRRRLYEKNYINVQDRKLHEGNLTVENFSFVNVDNCKKLVDEALPALFAINPNEVVCYSNEHYYISNIDAGAPAIHKGHLVAVTVGGVKYGIDHMGVGIKMDCFCSWIKHNLPPGDNKMECCRDCCISIDEHPILREPTHVKRTENGYSNRAPIFFQ